MLNTDQMLKMWRRFALSKRLTIIMAVMDTLIAALLVALLGNFALVALSFALVYLGTIMGVRRLEKPPRLSS
jgi:hypothetical protein